MHPAEQMRAALDKLRKTYAKAPLLATGGDNRMTAEAVNTGAIARMQGRQRQIPRGNKTLALSELMRKPG